MKALFLVFLLGCASVDDGKISARGQAIVSICEGTYTVTAVNDSIVEVCEGLRQEVKGGQISDNFTEAFKALVALPGIAARAMFTGGL